MSDSALIDVPADLSVQWETPPPRNAASDWRSRLLPLMVAPMRWARLVEYRNASQSATCANKLRRRKVVIPAGRWEFTARRVAGAYCVFGRYLGPEEPSK